MAETAKLYVVCEWVNEWGIEWVWEWHLIFDIFRDKLLKMMILVKSTVYPK